MKLLIRNIAHNTTKASIRTLFKSQNTIQFYNLVMDKETGSSKGFGFVEMPKKGEAKAAIKVLNGMELDGSKIRVKKAEEKQTKPVSARNKSVWPR